MQHDAKQPLNRAVLTGVHKLFAATALVAWQPRVSVAYKLSNNMDVRAGAGIFNDIIAGQVTHLGTMNPPVAPVFVGGINGQVGGIGIAPGAPKSAVDATSQANRAFQTVFRSGGSPCTDATPGAPVCPLAVNLNTFPAAR